jgi:aryl-alcohol dehydrogenase-like predicted oxidoreductase
LNHYLDVGGNFIDTANVYGGGLSESTIAQVLRERVAAGKQTGRVYVVTKVGRSHGDPEARISDAPHSAANYTAEAVLAAVEGSRRRLGVDCLDLVQLHCPPLETLKVGSDDLCLPSIPDC